MNVLFISYNGAQEPLIKSQGIPYLLGLSKMGVRCALLTFEKPDLVYQTDKRGTAEELKKSNIEWYWLKYHKKPTLPATFFDIVCGVMMGIYIVIVKKIDIIHSRAAVAGIIGYIIAKCTRRKFLLDERGLMAEEYVDGGMWKRDGLLYKVTLWIEKIMLRKASAVVVLTENIRNYLLNSDYLYRSAVAKKLDISVIPCCVDLRTFKQPFPRINPAKLSISLTGKFVFVYSGSLGTWYLLDEMCDFFATAKTLIKNAHFLILTHSPREYVSSCWSRKQMDPQDLTVRACSFEDMPSMLKLADAGVFFIKPSLSKRASCPIKFAEFLAAGVPVIINSGIGDTDTIVKNNNVGVVISEFNSDSYLEGARGIVTLVKDKDSLQNKCYNVVQKFFSLDAGVLSYSELYRSIT